MNAPAALESPDPRLGTTLNERYKITRKIGEGGMGLVYEGEHLIIRRRVAIKMLHAQMSQNPEVVARFKREAIAATSIRHPHIIEVLDMGTAPDGASYMVLEFLEGQDWSHEIEATGPQALAHVVKIMLEVCDGLQAAHDRGIVHRDLKPENVFLTKHGKRTDFVKIVDFGISKIMDEGDPAQTAPDKKQHSLTKTGAAMGTPYSMAPEQLKGSRDVDQRADLWALGVMLFHALTAGYPFDGETFPMLAVNVLTGDAPPLSRFRGDLPPEIQAVVDRLLQKDKLHRFQSARDVRAALEPFQAASGAPMVVTRVGGVGDTANSLSGIQPTALGQGTLPAGAPVAPVAPPVGAATGAMAGQHTPSSVPMTSITPAGLLATGTPAAMAAVGNGTLSGTIPGLPSSSSNRTPMIVGGVGVVAAAAVAITWIVMSSSGPPPATVATTPPPPVAPPTVPEVPPVAPPPVPTVLTPPAPGVATVRVQISTDPPTAELFLDGSPIGNPFDADLPSNTDVHHIEARMTGRVTAARDISLAFPQRIVLELAREGRGGSHSSGGSTSSSSSGATTTSSSGATTGSSSGTVATGSSSGASTPPPHVDPPAVHDDPPASSSSSGGSASSGGETSSGGRPLRDPFGAHH